MKRLTAILLMTTVVTTTSWLSSCSEDEKGPHDGMGCMTGVYKGGGSDRVSMGCHTYKTFLAGDNVNAGGLSYAGNYTQVEWEQVDDCSECQ